MMQHKTCFMAILDLGEKENIADGEESELKVESLSIGTDLYII